MNSGTIITAVIVILLVVLLISIIKAPMKLIFKLLLNMLSGLVTLFIFNFLAGIFGFTLTINWLNCLVAGVLGIPGVVLLVLLRIFL